MLEIPKTPGEVIQTYLNYNDKSVKTFFKRLEKLAEVLSEESKKDIVTIGKKHIHFNMCTFGEQEPEVCGTIACAAGTAGLHPWFRKRGFKLELIKDGTGGAEGSLTYEFEDEDGLVEEECDLHACYAFFGSAWPFSANFPDSHSATPKQVAKMIRTMIKDVKKARAKAAKAGDWWLLPELE